MFLFALTLRLNAVTTSPTQQQAGAIRGQVRDELGGVVVGAKITVAGAAGSEQVRMSDDAGKFLFDALPPATYTVLVEASGFCEPSLILLNFAGGCRNP